MPDLDAIIRDGLGPDGQASWTRWLALEASEPDAFNSPFDPLVLCCTPCQPIGFWL